ncbi:MAG: SxtJ family membrane protein [Saprospiraceae bacterium]|nr:SxtJ family membrane protein [Saprospiraceae bacterium]
MEKRLKSLESCLVITAGLLVLFFWLKNPWLLRGALAVGVLGALSPWAATKIHQGWTLLARGLGWFNGRVLLSAVFYLFLTPIAWLARKFGASSMQLRKKTSEASYYVARDHRYEPKDLENTW